MESFPSCALIINAPRAHQTIDISERRAFAAFALELVEAGAADVGDVA
jgi:hypothetical protein